VLRHEFQPGRLVGGLFLIAAGIVYAGDARGLWHTPWFVSGPLVVGGLVLAGAVSVLCRAVRRTSRRAGQGEHRPPRADEAG